ncbi:MAG: fumarylacetoacetate hydrolase family protein [Aquabacterium sp.]
MSSLSPLLPRLTGTIVGTLLNHRPALAALGDAASAPPSKAPPQAPVLYVKPHNTQVRDGALVHLPPGESVQVAACLGLVIGATACRVSPAAARSCIAGAVAVADLSLPHASFYRPSLRFKVRDGFCPMGDVVAMPAAGPDALGMRVFIDGQLAHETDTGDRIRDASQLVADISGFMTPHPGDVVLTGASHGAPLARAGQAVRIEIDGLPALGFRLAAEEVVA